MSRRIIGSIGAAVGTLIGAAINDVFHLSGFLPYLVVGIGGGGGAILGPLIFDRK
jgi:hypothetical protein